MLDGFEEYTEDLTLDEKILAQSFVEGFKKYVGRANSVTNRQIRERLAEKGVKISDPKIRKLVSYIRLNYLPHLCASSKGYYLAATKEELKAYLKSSWQRISQQHAAYEAGFNYMEKMQ